MIAIIFLLGAAQEDVDVRKPAWMRLASPVVEDFSAVFFSNPKTGWILSEGGTVLKTIDGGASWKVRREGARVESSRPFEHLWFKDERRGWIAQCCSACDLAGIQPVLFLTTDDGGETWSKTELADVEERRNLIQQIRFMAATGERWQRSHQRNVCFRSPGGDEARLANYHPGLAAFGAMAETDYLDVAFATKDAGMLVGRDAAGPLVLRTDDGGATWTRQTVAGLKAKSARRIWMSGALQARIVPEEGASLWATRDGGKTWTAEWTGKPGEQVDEILFPVSGIGIAIGSGGLLLRHDAR